MNAYLSGQFIQSKLWHLCYSIIHSENDETGINSIRQLFNVCIVSMRYMDFLPDNFLIFHVIESNLGILFFDIIPCLMVFKFKESNFPLAFQRYRLREVSLVFCHCIFRIITHRTVARKGYVKVSHDWLCCFRKCSIPSDLLYWNGTYSSALDFISISIVSNFFIRTGTYIGLSKVFLAISPCLVQYLHQLYVVKVLRHLQLAWVLLYCNRYRVCVAFRRC